MMTRALEQPAAAAADSGRRSNSAAAVEAGRAVLLYDGACPMCRRSSERLLRWTKPGAVERVDFNDPGALDPFPSITMDDCMQAMHFITPDGRVYRAFEAAVRALMTRGWLRPIVAAYYIPGIRHACEMIYRRIARSRHRCTDASCSI